MFSATGAISSSSPERSTSAARCRAWATFWLMSRPSFAAPCSLMCIQALSARNPRDSCTP